MMLINGIPMDRVSESDRGLTYGDGVFRTLVMRDRLPIWWDRHFLKLSEDCARLGILCPPKNILGTELAMLGENNRDCIIKLLITRGQGARGYAIKPDVSPTRILGAFPLPVHPEAYREAGVRVRVCDLRLSHQPRLAGIKHLNRLENVLARMEWDDPGIAEGLLLDQQENVISGTMSNLILLMGKTLVTPDLSQCGVAGVTRQSIMALAAEWGWQIKVQAVSLSHLLEADEVLLCNSVIGVWQVAAIDETKWHAGSQIQKIRCALHGSN